MNSLLFKIMITMLSMYADFAFGLSDLDEFLEAISSRDREQDDDSVLKFTNNTIMIFVPQAHSEDNSSSYEDAERKVIIENLSDEFPNEDNIRSKERNTLRSVSTVSGAPSTKRSRQQVTTPAPNMSVFSEAKQRAHERRIKEVSEHMAEHFMSTLYFYNEIKRIQKDHVVMDELRIMAVELEHPNNRWMKKEIHKCFRIHTQPVPRPIWNKKTNNLVINVVQNSINDGVPI